ncbi:hypothetical protein D9M70_479620 [compost metagenome]
MRQVAGHLPERSALPEINVVAIEEDAARGRFQNADKEAGKRRLSRSRRPDDAEHLARRKRKSDALDDRHIEAGGGIDQFVDDEIALRARLRHRLAYGEIFLECRLDPSPTGDGQHPLAPVFDHRIKWGEKASDQNGRGHHRAGRDLLLHHEDRARRQRRRLDHEAQRARDGGHRLASAAADFERVQRMQLRRAPAAGESREHAHCLNRLGVAQARTNFRDGLDIGLIGLFHQPASQQISQQSTTHEQGNGNGAKKAEHRVQRKEHAEEDRRPGGIERCTDGGGREKAAQLSQVP